MENKTETLNQTPSVEIPKKEINKEISWRKKSTLDEKIIELLLRQLYKEYYNHNLYQCFSNWYGVKGYALLEKYFQERAKEELRHASWIMKYFSDCDVFIKFPAIPEISQTWDDMVTPFKLTVDAEIETTMMIYEIADYAIDSGDWTTWQWLNGNDEDDGKLIREQREEEAISRTALDIAEGEGSWYRKEKSIYAVYTNDLD